MFLNMFGRYSFKSYQNATLPWYTVIMIRARSNLCSPVSGLGSYLCQIPLNSTDTFEVTLKVRTVQSNRSKITAASQHCPSHIPLASPGVCSWNGLRGLEIQFPLVSARKLEYSNLVPFRGSNVMKGATYVGGPCHVQDISHRRGWQNEYRVPLTRSVAVAINRRMRSGHYQCGWFKTSGGPAYGRYSNTICKALESRCIGPLRQVHDIHSFIYAYTSVRRTGCKFQSPLSRSKFQARNSLSRFGELRFCCPSRGCRG
mmetsp:Transcript_8244/g.13041  ORF Transcript_8244/g.13041 Transcript_8244/m.13041 type:complete len:258 (-) Transcript_8244:426-1199(-)